MITSRVPRRWTPVLALVPAVSAAGTTRVATVPDFRSAAIPKPPPFMFFTPSQIEAAKRNASAIALRPVFERLKAAATEALELRLDPFPIDWWQQAKTKPWSETYPEVYLHTCLEPLRLAVKLDVLVRYVVLTGDEPARARARAALLHFATFSFEPEHYDTGMNYSVWAVHVLRAYDALHADLTADERRRLDDFFTRLGRAVLKNDVYWVEHNIGGGINNHLAWHKMMLGMLGVFYHEEPLVEYALDGRRGLIELLESGLTDDGLWCEGSLVYHFAAIVPMVLYADTLRRAGHPRDLFTMTLADGRTLRQPVDVMLDVLFPNRMIPPVGDAYGARADLADNPIYEYAWAAWGDPRHAWLLSQRGSRPAEALFVPPLPAETQAPDIRSRMFPEHGYVFLRSPGGPAYWGSDARCAFLTYDRAGVHSHADKLSIMLFGCGKLLLPDVEGRATVPHAFSSRIQNELNRGALSQNTVMIDGKDQRSSGDLLDLVEFRDLPAEKRVTAADRQGILCEGVRQQRTICLTEHYTLDVFQVACDSPRQIDWVMHVLDPQAQRTGGLELKPAAPPARDGAWVWLRDFRAAPADDDWFASWQSDGVHLRLDAQGEPGTQVIECGYPATDEPAAGRIPMLLVRRKARQTVFAVVYTVGRALQGKVRLESCPDREDRMVWSVETAAGRGVHLVPRLRPFP